MANPLSRVRHLGLALLAAGLVFGLGGCSGRGGGSAPANTGMAGGGPRGGSAALDTLEAIRVAYVEQDMERVLALVDPGFYPDLSRFRRALYEDREQITQVALEFHPGQEIAGDGFTLMKVRWNRRHTQIATGQPVLATGQAEFQFGFADGRLYDIRPQGGGMPIGFN